MRAVRAPSRREPALVPGDYSFAVKDLEAVHARAKEVNALYQEDAHDDSDETTLFRG